MSNMDEFSDSSLSLDTNATISAMGPHSPLDMKPDFSSGAFSPGTGAGPNSPNLPQSSLSLSSAGLLNSGNGGTSLNGVMTNGGNNNCSISPNSNNGSNRVSPNGQYPPNHPLSGSKHLCCICGDRASGKHYGVYSCEGCKGFFKRTVRKDLSYACREARVCTIDKRHRNRCQYCRYRKCLTMGMKREAVQEERQRTREREGEVESTSSAQMEMPLERIIDAEKLIEQEERAPLLETEVKMSDVCIAADKQLHLLVEWAKSVPHYKELSIKDRVLLLRTAWNEILIAGIAFRSLDVRDALVLANGLTIHRNSAHLAELATIFDRILEEIVKKFRDLRIDKAEFGCIKAIILFNPDAPGLPQSSMRQVEHLRDQVYATLEDYTRSQYPSEPGRFAKLLLRLPALRSIGLKCYEHVFFYRLTPDTSIDSYLTDRLSNSDN